MDREGLRQLDDLLIGNLWGTKTPCKLKPLLPGPTCSDEGCLAPECPEESGDAVPRPLERRPARRRGFAPVTTAAIQ